MPRHNDPEVSAIVEGGAGKLDDFFAQLDRQYGNTPAAEEAEEAQAPATQAEPQRQTKPHRIRGMKKKHKDLVLRLKQVHELDPAISRMVAEQQRLYAGFIEDGKQFAARVLAIVAEDLNESVASLQAQKLDGVINRWMLQGEAKRAHPDTQYYELTQAGLTAQAEADAFWVERTTTPRTRIASEKIQHERDLFEACRLRRIQQSGMFMSHAQAVERLYLTNATLDRRWDEVRPMYRAVLLQMPLSKTLTLQEIFDGHCPGLRIEPEFNLVHAVMLLEKADGQRVPVESKFEFLPKQAEWNMQTRCMRVTLRCDVKGMQEWVLSFVRAPVNDAPPQSPQTEMAVMSDG